MYTMEVASFFLSLFARHIFGSVLTVAYRLQWFYRIDFGYFSAGGWASVTEENSAGNSEPLVSR